MDHSKSSKENHGNPAPIRFNRQSQTNDFSKVFGIMSREEADELLKVIEEGCGKIDPNGW